MQIIVKSKNFIVQDEIKSYINKKIGRLKKYFDHIIEAEVEVIQQKDAQNTKKIEVTIYAPGKVIRGEESAGDIFEVIDKVVEKLEKQTKKYKEKLKNHKTKGAKDIFSEKTLPDEERIPQIVKTKRFAIKPMDEDEAMMQMKLLGHSFFVFLNSKTEKVNVLYKRKDGNFGLIEPEF